MLQRKQKTVLTRDFPVAAVEKTGIQLDSEASKSLQCKVANPFSGL